MTVSPNKCWYTLHSVTPMKRNIFLASALPCEIVEIHICGGPLAADLELDCQCSQRNCAPPCLDDGKTLRGYRSLRNADCDATLLNKKVNPLGHSERRRKLDLSPTTPASCASLWALHFASAWGSEGEVVQEREQWTERWKELMKGTEARMSSERRGRRN